MAENRRALLKPTSTDKLKESVSEDDQYVNSGKGGEYHKFEHGINSFRLYPKHPKEKAFYKLVGSHWGTIEGEDGKPQRRKIPNGKLHGGLSKSLINTFIEMCGAKLDGDDSEDKAKLDALVDSKDGIQMKTSWVCYADKIVNKKPTFGVLEFKKTVRDRINEESNVDGAEEAITIDPFTDTEDGKLLIVDYDSKAKSGNKYYKSIRVGKSPYPLSDEQVDYFLDEVKPLSKLGIFQYGDREFETELEIIKFIDEANDIGIYDSDEFQAVVKSMKKELKTRKSATASAEEAAPVKKKKPAVEDDDDEDAPPPKKAAKDEFAGMDRDELKEYIVENDLGLGVKKSWSDEELRDQIRALVHPKKKPKVEEEEDAPPPKKKKPAEDEDDDAPPPPKKKKPAVEDDDDDVPPPKKKKPAVEDDDDDPKSSVDLKKIKAKLREADEDDDD